MHSKHYPDQQYLPDGDQCSGRCPQYQLGHCALTGEHRVLKFARCTVLSIDLKREAMEKFPKYANPEAPMEKEAPATNPKAAGKKKKKN